MGGLAVTATRGADVLNEAASVARHLENFAGILANEGHFTAFTKTRVAPGLRASASSTASTLVAKSPGYGASRLI